MKLAWLVIVGCSSGAPSVTPAPEPTATVTKPVPVTKPVADRPSCEHACRNFASLKYWKGADAEIAALPAADQAAARTRHTQDFATKVEVGLDACVSSCVSANNADQTACLGKATTVDALAACEN